MHINPQTGRVDESRQIISPNADERPDVADLDLVVIHSISLPPAEYGGNWIERFFCNELPSDAHPYFAEICELEVSSHVLIKRDGELVQFVPFHCRAWHAGASEYEGRTRCNDFSIGIELEGTDDSEFEDAQYAKLAQLIKALSQAYPGINTQRVTGHSDIAPGRKTDPGTGFDWSRLRQLLDDQADGSSSA